MVLNVAESVWATLGDSHVVRRMGGVAQYQDRQQRLDIATTGDVTFQATQGVQSDAEITVYGHGDPSLVPTARTDLLAPYGQEVTLWWEVEQRGGAPLTIPIGVYRVVKNDGGEREQRSGVTLGWRVGVSLADRIRMLEQAKIVLAKSPRSTSMYAELQALSLFPLVTSVPDAVVPAGMAYDDRLQAVQDLAALAGAEPAVTRQGALTLRQQDRWRTATVPEFKIEGSIGPIKREQADDFVNMVWAHSDDGRFSGIASIDDDANPLSVRRAGLRTYEHSSPVYTSDPSALAGAKTILDRLSRRRSTTVSATVDARGILLDLGDYGQIVDQEQGRTVIGEVTKITMPCDPTKPIDLQLIVPEEP